MNISTETRKRLIEYAAATQRYEIERRRIYDRDGGYREISPTARTIDEYFATRADLLNCSEPEVRALVHQFRLEQVDEAMADETKTELDVLEAQSKLKLADNELVALGHKYRAEQETKIQPLCRRRDVRRSRRTARPRRRG